MHSDVITHFNKRAEKYDQASWVKDERILSTIERCIKGKFANNCSILDLGAGTGAVSEYLLARANNKPIITAFDISPAMLDKIKSPLITKVVGSMELLPFGSNTFDVIIARQSLHYVKHLDNAINEIKRVLKSDGIFVLSQIMPLDSSSKDFWVKMMKIRQPLRLNYFTKKEWEDYLTNNNFLISTTDIETIRYSIQTWADIYDPKRNQRIDYNDILSKAPSDYIRDYDVVQDHSRTWMNAFFVTMSGTFL